MRLKIRTPQCEPLATGLSRAPSLLAPHDRDWHRGYREKGQSEVACSERRESIQAVPPPSGVNQIALPDAAVGGQLPGGGAIGGRDGRC